MHLFVDFAKWLVGNEDGLIVESDSVNPVNCELSHFSPKDLYGGKSLLVYSAVNGKLEEKTYGLKDDNQVLRKKVYKLCNTAPLCKRI